MMVDWSEVKRKLGQKKKGLNTISQFVSVITSVPLLSENYISLSINFSLVV